MGCSVVVAPGLAGAPDSGVITMITQATVTAGGQPLAVAGSLCLMTNSVTGAPYTLPIGSVGGSTSFTIGGKALVRVGDRIPSGPGVMTILGPPAAPFVTDGGPP
jgi:hypothetical protein